MAYKSINALLKSTSDVNKIRSVLESKTKRQVKRRRLNEEVDVINQETGGFTPLHFAIVKRLDEDIVKELLKFGAVVTQKVFMEACYYNHSKASEETETHYCKIITLLLEYGANVNGDSMNSSLVNFLIIKVNLTTKVFIPILQKMLLYADQSTKTSALHMLLKTSLLCLNDCWYEEERVQDNAIQAVKLLLESGAEILEEVHLYCFDAIEELSCYASTVKAFNFAMILFKVVVPYFHLRKPWESHKDMSIEMRSFKNHIDHIISRSENRKAKAKRVGNSLKKLWRKCLQDCHKLKFDILDNRCCLLLALQALLEKASDICSDKAKLPSDTVFEIMCRFARGEYRHFSVIMIHLFNHSDSFELYILMSERYLSPAHRLNYDCFCKLARYLSKEDMYNYILSLFPKKLK